MDKVDLISTVDILYMVDSLDSLDIADNVNMEEHKHGYAVHWLMCRRLLVALSCYLTLQGG